MYKTQWVRILNRLIFSALWLHFDDRPCFHTLSIASIVLGDIFLFVSSPFPYFIRNSICVTDSRQFNNELEHTAFVVHQPTLVSVAIAERRHINSIYESWHLENHKIYHRHWCAPYTPSVYSPPAHRMSTTMRRDLF